MSGIADQDLLKIAEQAAGHLDGLEHASERKRQAFVDWVTTSPRHVEEALRMAELNTTLSTLLRKKSQDPRRLEAPKATRQSKPDPGILRTIRRYPNRRLYDPVESRYIKLSDIWSMVIDQIQFVVIDVKSQEDVTRSMLLQLIAEQEHLDPMLSQDFLVEIIRSYGGTMQEITGSYLEQSLKLFASSLRNAHEQSVRNPTSALSTLAQENYQRWRQVMDEIARTLMNEGKKQSDTADANLIPVAHTHF
jgi:polyhydroxyalkanoate synthesis repressor PhaR